MNTYLHHQYRETRNKFNKYSARLRKSQEKGEFFRYSKRKQHFLLSRIRKLWEKLRILEARLKLATLGTSLALILMVSSTHAQQFVEAPEKNPLSAPTIFGEHMQLLDVDGDDDLDILTSFYYRRIEYYENTGGSAQPLYKKVPDPENPFFEALDENYFNIYYLRGAADIDGDGDMDLLMEDGEVLINNGSNDSIAYKWENLPSESMWRMYNLGDIDDDGDMDVINMDPERGVIVNENTGNSANFVLSDTETVLPVANWNTAIDGISDFKVADLDGDGDLDIFFTSGFDTESGWVQKSFLLKNIGTSENAAFLLESDQNNPYQIAAEGEMHLGDLDGDGDYDLIAESYPAMYRYYTLHNNTLSENQQLIPELYDGVILPYSYHAPQFVDFDGDGDLDIFAGEEEITYYEQVRVNGNPRFVKKDFLLPFLQDYDSESFLGFADLDKDGDEDILFVTTEYNQEDYKYNEVYLLFENRGSAQEPDYTQRPSASFGNIEDFLIPSFVDIDDDGDLDLFMMGVERIQGDWTLRVRYFESTGEDPFEFTERFGLNANPLDGISDAYYPDVEYSGIQFSDMDHDGDYDAVFNDYYGKIYYLENRGTAAKAEYVDVTNTGPFFGISAGELSSISLVDIDGDGDDDLFTHEEYSMVSRFYENTAMNTSNQPPQEQTGTFTLYPNPVTEELKIQFEAGLFEFLDIEIINLQGELLAKERVHHLQRKEVHAIDTESLAAGCYLIRIRAGGKALYGKFIKQ